ncbi:MAG: hypothetical protein A2639_00015 [Candidatus Staskawiczbacteria bacterium RIFCSPHIGHO2_01_FULL_34_27]|uniref:N-acetyltransferase domain-containing protein n=1 Tax=Candidatus Staskawiczbacteria bacterium RIFCSPHIGHO2_01_FULL_34_27 TaxID=1802199 RepID=A0A1G2HK94_9BACT|nr:MAG: hypothetical protein A2639_00015 [Candidatus Staskawiczbacteria bacterium RIFCSPHIGHO2_01_FULL_34_27]
METKIFGDNKLVIKQINKADLKKAKDFQEYINSFVAEDAKLLMNKKATLKDEIKFLENILKITKRKTKVFLIAKHGDRIVGTVSIELEKWRKNHIGKLGIAIRNSYREIGLGKYLMAEIIKLAKKELHPAPKIIQLEVYTNNKPAINLYKKMGFKNVAKLSSQVQYKGKLVSEYIMMYKVK